MSEDEKDPEIGQKLQFPNPVPIKRPKRMIVQRNPTPTVNRMLDDAYHVLATQLGLFRGEAHQETFTVQKASAFSKLVTSLTSLQETERKRTALLNLSSLSDDELAALDASARQILGEGDPTRHDT